MDILKLLTTQRTAWSLREIAMTLGISSEQARFKVSRWCKRGYLRRLRKGIYVRTDREYNPLEVAGLVFKPSYVSFNTALFAYGAITQGTWTVVTIASYLTREVVIDGWILRAVKLRESILYMPYGLVLPDKCEFGYVTMASPERALLDALYFYKMSVDVQFPDVFNRKELERLLNLYFRSRTTKRKYKEMIEKTLQR